MLAALIFDIDGTMAETERDGHLVAFNDAFDAHGLPWHWSVEHYSELLQITGGRERLLYDMARRKETPTDSSGRESMARALHAEKNRRYGRIVERGGILLRPGVTRLLREAQAAGVRLAIASTTSRVNADALLGAQIGRDWQQHFAAVICGEDAPQRKPDPQCYLRCLEALDLDPDEVVAIEDSPNGLAAANAAGIATLVTRSVFFASHAYPGAMAVCDGLEDPAVPAPNLAGARPARVDLAQLREWHAAWGEPVQAAA
ncbi:HAD-IA family hydrolase [Methylibium sp.]|uniref:HAD-IA family hydrolase n=1 Tax=Methylibium sp. TaxID=2067992 RepID=UPI00184EE257|nr:HAD-IA family hydrolase [Methylibium sp.]MBA3590831.1 HAD-IA family hydrolase [Methylibium sp.]